MAISDFLRREGETDSAFADRTRALMASHPLTGAAKAEDALFRAIDARNAADASGDASAGAEAANAVHLARSMVRGFGRSAAWSRAPLTRA